MFTFLLLLLIVVFLKLVFVAAMRPARPVLSQAELARRAEAGDTHARHQLEQLSYTSDVRSILTIVTGLLLIVAALVAVATFGWLWGIFTSLVVVLMYGSISRLALIRRLSARMYGFYGPHLFKFVKRFPGFMKVIAMYVPNDDSVELRLGSRSELEDLVDSSVGILSQEEKKLITHSLSFASQQVSSVMTPSAAVMTIKKDEFLGPLTLDELHKKGHSRLPVIDQDIDHIIGVLYLQNLLTLDVKKSVTAEKAMDPRVFYIRSDQTLHHALAAFIKTHQHVLIVINEYRETVGLLTLTDVTEALLGRKVVDEFEGHEDKHTVALRNSHDNNQPKNHEDV
jgi:CBS domain containing-hemolysin-like protein